MTDQARKIKLAVMGFGNAAKAFSKLLIQQREQLLNEGLDFELTAISTGSKGNLIGSFKPEEVLNHLDQYGNFRDFKAGVCNLTTLELIEQADYDVMIELTPLQIFSGQPAIDHIKLAMSRGKHVITANKGPIAWAYKELTDLAKDQKVGFYYETTVMDGTPIFNMTKASLPYCNVTEIKGILNTTTNFVLEHLERGEALEAVMDEGRRRGFVEADPSLDIDGWDAAAKLTALANVLMNADLKPTDIMREGISGIDGEKLKDALSRGMTIKLLCRAYYDNEKLKAEVKPVELPLGELYAAVDETSSVVSITTDLMGEISIFEHRPEIEQTGYGVFSDLINLCRTELRVDLG